MTLSRALLILPLLMSLLSAPASAQSTAEPQALPNPFFSENVEELQFGLYCAEPPTSFEDAPDTAAGVVNIVPAVPDILIETVLVPAELGVSFGLLILNAPGAVMDPVQITIIHPPYLNSGIEVEGWQTDIGDDGYSLIGFTFEHAYEVVPGPWVMEGHFQGELQFRVTFEVLPPSQVPNLSGLCLGNLMS